MLVKVSEARRAMIGATVQALSGEQQAAGAALRELSQAIVEIPDHGWPATPP